MFFSPHIFSWYRRPNGFGSPETNQAARLKQAMVSKWRVERELEYPENRFQQGSGEPAAPLGSRDYGALPVRASGTGVHLPINFPRSSMLSV